MAAEANGSPALRVDELFPLIFAFNYRPSTYLHESWVQEIMPVELWPALSRSRRVQAQLSALILERAELTDQVEFDFTDKRRRIALVDGATLGRALRTLGVALNWSWIRKIIDRSTLQSLTQAVGEASYNFALQRAPFMQISEQRPLKEEPDPERFADYFDRSGAALLSACFASEPEAVVQRLRLKLPAELPFESAQMVPEAIPASPEQMYFKMVTEIEPQWGRLFA